MGVGRVLRGSDEDVIVKTALPALDVTHPFDLGGMSGMVRRAAAYLGAAADFSPEEVVGIGAALRPIPQADGGKKYVVIDQEGPVVHFDEEVVGSVLIEEIAGNTSAFGAIESIDMPRPA